MEIRRCGTGLCIRCVRLESWSLFPVRALPCPLALFHAGKEDKPVSSPAHSNVMDILQARAGDTLVTVAARFETTLKKLLSVNPHIVDEDELLAGEKKSTITHVTDNCPVFAAAALVATAASAVGT